MSNILTMEDFNKKVTFIPYKKRISSTMPKASNMSSILIPCEDMIIGMMVTKNGQDRPMTMMDFEKIPDDERSLISPYRQSNLHIRYLQGESSIFVDEQNVDKEIAKRRKKQIQLNDGFLIVNKDEITKLNFLNACNYNASNKHRSTTSSVIFERWDPSEASKKANDAIVDEAEALITIGNMNGPELEVFAMALGEDIKRFRAIAGMDTDSLRREMIIKVKQKPEIVKTVLGRKDTAIRAIVAKGLAEGVWDHDVKSNTVMWTKNQRVITNLPYGGEPITTIVNMIQKDKVYQDHFDELKTQLGYDPLVKKASIQVDRNRAEKKMINEGSHREKLKEKHGDIVDAILQFIESGALKATNPANLSISWFGTTFEDVPRKWHGMKKMVEALENEEGLLKELTDAAKAIVEA